MISLVWCRKDENTRWLLQISSFRNTKKAIAEQQNSTILCYHLVLCQWWWMVCCKFTSRGWALLLYLFSMLVDINGSYNYYFVGPIWSNSRFSLVAYYGWLSRSWIRILIPDFAWKNDNFLQEREIVNMQGQKLCKATPSPLLLQLDSGIQLWFY